MSMYFLYTKRNPSLKKKKGKRWWSKMETHTAWESFHFHSLVWLGSKCWCQTLASSFENLWGGHKEPQALGHFLFQTSGSLLTGRFGGIPLIFGIPELPPVALLHCLLATITSLVWLIIIVVFSPGEIARWASYGRTQMTIWVNILDKVT